MQSVLSDPLIIGIWTNQQQLPNDDFSVDNAIIISNCNRTVLLIDPQNQASEWINETYRQFEVDSKKKKQSMSLKKNQKGKYFMS